MLISQVIGGPSSKTSSSTKVATANSASNLVRIVHGRLKRDSLVSSSAKGKPLRKSDGHWSDCPGEEKIGLYSHAGTRPTHKSHPGTLQSVIEIICAIRHTIENIHQEAAPLLPMMSLR